MIRAVPPLIPERGTLPLHLFGLFIIYCAPWGDAQDDYRQVPEPKVQPVSRSATQRLQKLVGVKGLPCKKVGG